jgi:hypothetical protein
MPAVAGVPNFTKRVYKKLIARRRPVRVYEIDEYGGPWYACRFRMKSGAWEYHHLAVDDLDNNWVKVKRRHRKRR